MERQRELARLSRMTGNEIRSLSEVEQSVPRAFVDGEAAQALRVSGGSEARRHRGLQGDRDIQRAGRDRRTVLSGACECLPLRLAM